MPLSFDIRTGNPVTGAISLGAMGDSYYEYLLKVGLTPASFSALQPHKESNPVPASSAVLVYADLLLVRLFAKQVRALKRRRAGVGGAGTRVWECCRGVCFQRMWKQNAAARAAGVDHQGQASGG